MDITILTVVAIAFVAGVVGGIIVADSMTPDVQAFRAMRAELGRTRELLAIALENR